MKSLKYFHFSILTGFLLAVAATSAYASPKLPAKDPNPNQPEASVSEVESRREDLTGMRLNGVAVPYEPLSYFSVTGFSQDAARAAGDTGASDGGGSLDFCHSDKWSSACLTGLIIYRCGQYTFPFTPYGCALAAASFVGALDMKRIDVNVDGTVFSLPVIFTSRLEKMIQDRLVQSDLQDLRGLLDYAAKSKSRFDLWEWFRAMTNGELSKTYERLGVLLQDTSGVEIQVEYLKQIAKARKFSAATMKAIDNLDQICYQLNNEILDKNDYRSWLRLYPMTKNLDAELTPLIYHFYPMSFLADRLYSLGYGSRLSTFIPFLFNTEYLNQTLQPEQWPFHHPKPFKIDSDFVKWKMRDMYGGYVGAVWGVQNMKGVKGLSDFQTTYAKEPYETMRHLFWSMPNP
ncbi:MAG: hypothetical protein JST04_04235 [Bdellovibrionales bacterium]|nr:hypothetical protein [Bdellovibrionales bacterium]